MNTQLITKGFKENQFDTGKVTLNYAEGPDNGKPLILIPRALRLTLIEKNFL